MEPVPPHVTKVIDHGGIHIAQAEDKQVPAMRKISVSGFKATCLALLESVGRAGEPLLITKRAEPLAQVLPPPPNTVTSSWFGSMTESGDVGGDIVEPLGPDPW